MATNPIDNRYRSTRRELSYADTARRVRSCVAGDGAPGQRARHPHRRTGGRSPALPIRQNDQQRRPFLRWAPRLATRRSGGPWQWAMPARCTTPTAAGRTPTRRAATLSRREWPDRIEVHVGDAMEFLSERKEQFDLLFCDIDEHDYPRAGRMAAPRVRRGGLFLTDNTLWKGKVSYLAGNADLKPEGELDRQTTAVHELNRMLYDSPRLVHDHPSVARRRNRGNATVRAGRVRRSELHVRIAG